MLAPNTSLCCSIPRQGETPKGISGFCYLLLPAAQKGQVDQLRVTQLFRGRPKRRLQPSHLKTTSHSQDVERVVNGKHILGTLSKGRRIREVHAGCLSSCLPPGEPLQMSVTHPQLSTPWHWGLPTQRPGCRWAQHSASPTPYEGCFNDSGNPMPSQYGDRNSEAEREGGT